MKTVDWQPTCTCQNDGTGKCVILDPFCGAGTVPLVALQYSRGYIGVELNPTYVELIHKRIATVQPNIWEASA
jgi:DNA modification methylase